MSEASFVDKTINQLDLEELKIARKERFLNDYQYLNRLFTLQGPELQYENIDSLTQNYVSEKLLPFRDLFRKTSGNEKMAEIFSDFMKSLDRFTYELFNNRFDDVYNDPDLMTEYASIHHLYQYAYDKFVTVFDERQDNIELGNLVRVVRNDDVNFIRSVKNSFWKSSALAENKLYQEALEVLEKCKDEKQNSYFNYKLWLLWLLDQHGPEIDNLYSGMKQVSDSLRIVKGTVFRFYLSRFYLRLWFITRDEKYLSDIKNEFKDSIHFYEKTKFNIELDQTRHIKMINAKEKTYAPYLFAFASLNKEQYM